MTLEILFGFVYGYNLVLMAFTGRIDFIVFGAGLVAGALIVMAIRRDFRDQWDGRERRRRSAK